MVAVHSMSSNTSGSSERREKSETRESTLKISVCTARKRNVHVLAKNKGGDEIYGIFNLQGWYPSL